MNVIILWIDESVHEVFHPALVAVVGAVGGRVVGLAACSPHPPLSSGLHAVETDQRVLPENINIVLSSLLLI